MCVYIYIYTYTCYHIFYTFLFMRIQGTHKLNPVCDSCFCCVCVDYVCLMCADYVRTFLSDYVRDYVRDFCVCMCRGFAESLPNPFKPAFGQA